jgi:hypothetical protein
MGLLQRTVRAPQANEEGQMASDDLAATVTTLMPFVPAKDFETSKRFYTDLGFQVRSIDVSLARVSLGLHGFLLQNYYVPEWANNFMFHMLVTDLDVWWLHINALDLPARYQVPSPRPPKLETWGLNEVHVIDPAGVLWHFAERPASTTA